MRVWNGRRPGASALSALGSSEKLDAAVLHQHAGCRQHAAGAEFPVERLDIGDGEAACVGRAHPDGVALPRRRRPARGFLHVDLRDLGVEKGGVEKLVEIAGDLVGVGDDAVAHAKGALGRLDQAVDVLEALRLA